MPNQVRVQIQIHLLILITWKVLQYDFSLEDALKAKILRLIHTLSFDPL